jgi:hypothetical protein
MCLNVQRSNPLPLEQPWFRQLTILKGDARFQFLPKSASYDHFESPGPKWRSRSLPLPGERAGVRASYQLILFPFPPFFGPHVLEFSTLVGLFFKFHR